jgi:GDP-4-dehydro-6-deoxy-D-mannose reductase
VRILITGVGGFVGPHLVRQLHDHLPDARLWGVDLETETGRLAGFDRLTLMSCDLLDPDAVHGVVAAARPDVVLHLAAMSTVAGSWTSPSRVLTINTTAQLHLFDALLAAGLSPVTVVASSAEIYGRAPACEQPLGEEAPLRPVSPYGVSKAAQDLIAFQYHAAHGLPTIRLRLFNHTGPGRPHHFVVSSFARQLAEIERGLREPVLLVGDIAVVRDFCDVRDVARAWQLAATDGAPGAAYNVCSERPVELRDLLQILLRRLAVDVEVRTDPARLRPADIPMLTGTSSRLRERTGWSAEIALERTAADLLDWWRARV